MAKEKHGKLEVKTAPVLTEEEEAIVKEVNIRFDRHITNRREQEKIWHICTAFFLGKQWQVWDKRTRTLREDNKVPKYRVRLTSNKIYAIVKTKIAQMLKAKPTFSVLPNTSEEEDAMAAKIGEKVLLHLWRKLNMDSAVLELSTWMFTCGTAFLKYTWNSQKGKYLGMQDGTPIFEGEMDVEVVSPFEIVVDSEAKNMDDLLWIQQAKTRSLDWIQSQFPEKGKFVKADGGKVDDLAKDLKQMSALASGSTGEKPIHDQTAIVKEYWHKPGARYPLGLHAIVAGKVVLFQEDMIKEKGDLAELPIIKFDENVMPGRFWSVSTVEQLIALQKEYNKSISQIVEVKNLIAKPKVLLPKGSGIAKSSFTTEPGEIIEHRPGMAPSYMPLPQLPVFVSENIMRISHDIDEISGVNEVSKGVRPEGTRSALQLQFLAEQDASKLATTITMFEKSLGCLGNRLLSMAQNKYKEERQLKIVGRNAEHELVGFKGADLKGNFDVDVKTMSALETSKSAMRAQILELVQFGFIKPDNTRPGKLLNILQLGNLNEFYDSNTLDETFSKRENMDMAGGEIAQVFDWQDHDVHVANHNEFRKTMEFQKLPDVTKEFFEEHIRQHLQRIEDQDMAAQLDAQALPQEGGGGAPAELADVLGQGGQQ